MNRLTMLLLLATSQMLAAPAMAGVAGFSIVNGVGADIKSMSIRRVGSAQWQPLSAAPATGKSAGTSFADPDCAFDLRATLASGAIVTWSGINLCDVKLLTLRRNDAGLAWVDYD